MTNEPRESLFIRDLIRRVHDELYESRMERKERNQEAIFEVSGLTLEVNFVVTEEKDLNGKLDFKVITAGAEKSYTQQQVQKLTLSLTAVPVTDSELEFDVQSSALRPREFE